MQVAADLTLEFFGPTWYRMPKLIEGLRAEWALNPSDISLEDFVHLSPILLFTKDYDLLRAIAERQLEIDPLSPASWEARTTVEWFAGNFDRAKEVVSGRAPRHRR